MNSTSKILIYSVVILFSCNGSLSSEGPNSNITRDDAGKIVSGEVTQYAESGKLASIYNVKDYKLHGEGLKYYDDGTTLRSELNYNMGKLDGLQKRYYESGALYKEELYVAGKRHGLTKKYRESGLLMTEAVYKQGQPGTELREYLTDGSLKKKYPSIVIEEIDKLRSTGVFTLRISMSDETKKVDYYIGELDENVFFSDDLKQQNNVNDGVLELSFFLKPASLLEEEISIVARMPTRLNNSFITSTKYSLFIQTPRN